MMLSPAARDVLEGPGVRTLQQGSSVKDFVRQCAKERLEQGKDDSFYVCNLSSVIDQHRNWCQLLPRVKPFYVVKCNNDPKVLRLMASMGINFGCLSKDEMKKILDLGVGSDRISYALPCKQYSHLEFAAKMKVDMMSFDDVTELYRIKEVMPQARLVLRVKPEYMIAQQAKMDEKFGCSPHDCHDLLQKAKDLNMNVVGVCFHLGAALMSVETLTATVRMARGLFDIARAIGYDLTLLNMGGGFPGHDTEAITFKQIAEGMNQAIDEYFPEGCGVDVVAEPGRYYVQKCFHLAMNIIAKKCLPETSNGFLTGSKIDGECDPEDTVRYMYYINDGIYGAFFFDVVQDEKDLKPVPLADDTNLGPRYPSIVWGSTADRADLVTRHPVPLPDLLIRDWLYLDHMGDYKMMTYCVFTGMPKPEIIYVTEDYN